MPETARIVFDILNDRLAGVTFEAFMIALAGFEFLPVVVGGETVGAIMRRGPELHAAVLPKARGKWLGRRSLAVVRDTIMKYGMATTSVMDGHEAGHVFARRLGFDLVRQSGGITYYRMESA